MTNRISVNDRLNKEKKQSPKDSLFKSTEQVEVTRQSKYKDEKENDPEVFERKTYYISKELTDALMIYKAMEDKDISVIVRQALYEYIPEEYLEQARKKNK